MTLATWPELKSNVLSVIECLSSDVAHRKGATLNVTLRSTDHQAAYDIDRQPSK